MPVNAMEATATDLRATSDALMRDLEVLAAIEEEKRTLAPGDPRLVELAQRVEDVARRVLSATVRQRQLTEVGSEQVEAAAPGTPTAPSTRRRARSPTSSRSGEPQSGGPPPRNPTQRKRPKPAPSPIITARSIDGPWRSAKGRAKGPFPRARHIRLRPVRR